MLMPARSLRSEVIPPPENGGRRTRDEFERRYEATPPANNAELIEGVVCIPSPVTFAEPDGPHADLVGILGNFRFATSGVRTGDNCAVRLDPDNEPQPGIGLFIESERGGQLQPEIDRSIEGAPELVVDMHAKRNVYRRNGVRDHFVWRMLDRAIDRFVPHDGANGPLPVSSAGIFRSEILPGLWLAAAAVLRGNWQVATHAVPQGIASPEHATFVKRLERHPNPEAK